MSTQLERVKKKEEQIKALRQKLEAAEKTRERKKDVRRKILLGALVLELMKKGDLVAKGLEVKLDGYLTRDNDRALFELSPLSESTGKKEATETA